MKRLIILIFFGLISCNSEMSLEKKYEVTYDLHIAENDIYIQSLLENIKLKMQDIKDEQGIKKLDSCKRLSNEYFNYLSAVEREVKEQGSEIFFDGDGYSIKGDLYIEKTNTYKNGVEKLALSKNFVERLNFTFNIKYVKSKNKIYFRYLDYYFKGFPKIQSLAYISDKKRRILEFENELIDETLVKIE